MSRIVIAGGPHSGKTTLALKLGAARGDCPVYHSDDAMALGWSECSAEVALWLDRPGPFIIEGVATVRALRKWMRAHDGAPCDIVLWLDAPLTELTPGQAALFKGCRTVWSEITPELVDRGVRVLSHLHRARGRGA